MIIEERITLLVNEMNDLQQQIKSIEAQTVVLQQRRETLILSYHRVDGALSMLNEIKREPGIITTPSSMEESLSFEANREI
jgi:hypothetical protein